MILPTTQEIHSKEVYSIGQTLKILCWCCNWLKGRDVDPNRLLLIHICSVTSQSRIQILKAILKVIQGDKQGMAGIGSGRVLESTNEYNVFMDFFTHGSDGLIEFPDGYLFGNKLQNNKEHVK